METHFARYLAQAFASTLFVGVALFGQEGKPQVSRAVTVADAIEMTRWAGIQHYSNAPTGGQIAQFSPDGKRFTVIVTKGDLERGTTQCSLLLFQVADVFRTPKPQVLLTMYSSSNREAIRSLRWLGDNETVLFLGENPGETAQVYTFNLRKRRLQRLTNHPTSIVDFDVTANGDEIIFKADPAATRMPNDEQVRHNGVIVSDQSLNQLIQGNCYAFMQTLLEGEQLFLKVRGQVPIAIPVDDLILDYTALSLSPHGHYALIETLVRDVPTTWGAYEDQFVREVVGEKREKRLASRLTRYQLLDISNGRMSALLDTPSDEYLEGFAWGPDGQALILSGAFLPLDVADMGERERRRKNPFVVEIGISSRSISEISDRRLKLIRWDHNANRVLLDSIDSGNGRRIVAYEKTMAAWKEASVSPEDKGETNAQVDLALEEDSNTPPKIYATDPKTKGKRVLIDLNPQFSSLRFGKVENVDWKATDGHKTSGGLYLPPDYIPGKRYPLVIQTHGYNKHAFWIDGPFSSAFAAQPLASRGFVVLQTGASQDEAERKVAHSIGNTSQEAPYYMAEYEGAIDYLDGRGLIDRNRVGIIGFSRTVYTVEYTLTHSRYPFGAATVADGMNGGYFTYVVFPNDTDERVNGGPPFGDTLSLWLKNSPGFNLDKVSTPIRIEAYGSAGSGALLGWEWFSGLSRLRKPVDLIYLPYAPHLLVQPWERNTSLQGNVDWFCFWLKDEEDPDPAKAEQYKRWRKLRQLQEENERRVKIPVR